MQSDVGGRLPEEVCAAVTVYVDKKPLRALGSGDIPSMIMLFMQKSWKFDRNASGALLGFVKSMEGEAQKHRSIEARKHGSTEAQRHRGTEALEVSTLGQHNRHRVRTLQQESRASLLSQLT